LAFVESCKRFRRDHREVRREAAGVERVDVDRPVDVSGGVPLRALRLVVELGQLGAGSRVVPRELDLAVAGDDETTAGRVELAGCGPRAQDRAVYLGRSGSDEVLEDSLVGEDAVVGCKFL